MQSLKVGLRATAKQFVVCRGSGCCHREATCSLGMLMNAAEADVQCRLCCLAANTVLPIVLSLSRRITSKPPKTSSLTKKVNSKPASEHNNCAAMNCKNML